MQVIFDPGKKSSLRALSEDLFTGEEYLEECIVALFDKLFGDRSVTTWKPGQVFYTVLRRYQDAGTFSSSNRYLLEAFHYQKNTPLLALILGEAEGTVGVVRVGYDPFQAVYYGTPQMISSTVELAKALLYQDDEFHIIVPSSQGGYTLAEVC